MTNSLMLACALLACITAPCAKSKCCKKDQTHAPLLGVDEGPEVVTGQPISVEPTTAEAAAARLLDKEEAQGNRFCC